MRGVISLIIILLLVTPAAALYRQGTDSYGTYHVEDPRHYPIIFIPGVAGSELWWGEKNAWPGWLGQRLTGGNFDKLALDEKGRSDYSILPRKSIRRGLEADLGGYGTHGLAPDMLIGIYGGFFDYMAEQNYSTEEDTETGLRLYDFPYDWRVDNWRTVEYLDVVIDQALEETKSDRVIIFAHSMGGVITRLYLQEEKHAKKVAGVVFMGSPHQGSPKPFYGYTHGYNFGNAKLSDTAMWEIMGNWEAGYQLLAHYPYVQGEDGEFWSTDMVYGEEWISQQEYEHYIADPENWKIRYGLPNRKYAKSVVKFQEDLGDTLDSYPWIKYYMIEGTGEETTQYFEAKLVEKPEVLKPVLYLTEVKNTAGDGTVPALGLEVHGLTEPPRLVYTDHGSIPAWPGSHPLLTRYREILNDEERRLGYSGDIWDYAEQELERVRSWPDSGSVMRALSGSIMGLIKPDKEKVAAREELRGSVKEMFQWAHVNIIVAKGTESEDHFFLVIEDHAVIDGEPGTVRPGTAKVYVDTWETLDALLDRRKSMRAAYEDGSVKVKGIGVVKSFQLKLFRWFSKFANRGSGEFTP